MIYIYPTFPHDIIATRKGLLFERAARMFRVIYILTFTSSLAKCQFRLLDKCFTSILLIKNTLIVIARVVCVQLNLSFKDAHFIIYHLSSYHQASSLKPSFIYLANETLISRHLTLVSSLSLSEPPSPSPHLSQLISSQK